MRYYYFNPFSKQYYFPVGFKNYPIFATFYQPYKNSAKIMWMAWQKSYLFRRVFSTDKPEKMLPIKNIQSYVTPDSILSFNLGTIGIEQKISILGVESITKKAFYIKYATSESACQNVFNEGIVLKQLSELPFVPKLQLSVKKENEFMLIKTTILVGEKMKHHQFDEQMLQILFTLSDQQVESNRKYESTLQCSFAHGDFCPWNMLVSGEDIKLFDWELAGQYPLGYDLFMYIFQYEFLVNETMQFEQMLQGNSDVIKSYFNHFGIIDWLPYLREFADLKLKLESEKRNDDLIESYLQLKEYAKKIQ
jgi:thiamine kinase-like enzyme